MNEITVIHRAGDAFAVLVRGHVICVDQPFALGGMDDGPTPVELFVASLAACAALHGRRHLRDHGIPADGLEVRGRFVMNAGARPHVARVDLSVRPPHGLSPMIVAGLRNAIDRCTVHNSLLDLPRITVDVETVAGTPVI
ncbi:OsmC family protein [Actinomadura miaoliensis]|uniref:OsmC family protein n=1 Tax=Actinomadura miaoliensis TaxID=430685 RepID=A0ABP7WP07_9ACTN